MGGVIYKEESYQIVGILFSAHNELGRYCKEAQYCDFLERAFKEEKIPYFKEKVLDPSFFGEVKGRNRVDFFVHDCIVLEIKCKRILSKEDYYQTQRYLTASNKKLALLVNFRDKYLRPRRVLNPNFK